MAAKLRCMTITTIGRGFEQPQPNIINKFSHDDYSLRIEEDSVLFFVNNRYSVLLCLF
uniref:Uncharacterized protein n=1 Tax=Lotus japonicus TaxID=34305 RepID=I3SRX2_LOTJA|nr:unknown [Lotus japonicus]